MNAKCVTHFQSGNLSSPLPPAASPHRGQVGAHVLFPAYAPSPGQELSILFSDKLERATKGRSGHTLHSLLLVIPMGRVVGFDASAPPFLTLRNAMNPDPTLLQNGCKGRGTSVHIVFLVQCISKEERVSLAPFSPKEQHWSPDCARVWAVKPSLTWVLTSMHPQMGLGKSLERKVSNTFFS